MSLSHSKIFRLACLRLQFFSTIISMNNWYFVPREPFLHPFCSTDSEPFWLRYAYTSSATIRSLKVVGKHAIGLKSPTFGAFVSSFISKLVLPNTIESWTFPVVRQLWRNSAIRLGNACTSSELPIFLFHHHSVFSIPVEFALSSLIYVWRFFLQDGSRWIFRFSALHLVFQSQFFHRHTWEHLFWWWWSPLPWPSLLQPPVLAPWFSFSVKLLALVIVPWHLNCACVR